MKQVLVTIGFLISVQFAFSQSAGIQPTNVVFKITISDEDAVNSKALKNLQFGNLERGESRTTFIVSTSKNQSSDLKKELEKLFPSVSIQSEVREEN